MNKKLISLSLTEVSKKMLETQALSGVSLNFEAGRIHGIIGPDGAGKTTFIRLAAKLLKPDSGSIGYFEDGKKIPDGSIQKRIAYLPQEQSLYADLSCMEHLEFFSNLYSMSKKDFKKKSARLLEMAGLSRFADRKAGNLSGGMYKKLGVICVLLNSPDLLLLDEPAIGVDPLSRRDLWELIRSVSNEMTVICSTSYMDEAEKCDKVHILNEGKVIASGLPDNIKKQFNVKKIEEVFLK
ncbi:MAG: ABC transporter ATP-binding protein [Endomicrobium sp.]|jgi:ABC-2 type transport system ATP-binding protein|nr:ABC transporter ATP-binding protein [Endomicrobium sp.]